MRHTRPDVARGCNLPRGAVFSETENFGPPRGLLQALLKEVLERQGTPRTHGPEMP
ncbi:hypothetical protein [Meiothermus sp.]|uniref:hypothetical protein n=1 Tax=Meiothermus sp. TaxID=1955249 RepID=UPI00298F3C17|nr:hypothetical protein [Meiothermus sp.]